jgi:GMP synthase (glutamine-hydrolysing)
MQEKILILDFGSQFTQLIARRVRELNIYCEIHPFNHVPEIDRTVKGIILSGSPYSVRQDDAPGFDFGKYHGNLPLLGVCYGAQHIAHNNGGEVMKSSTREYGRANLQYIKPGNPLFKDIPLESQVWMSHADTIARIPDNFEIIASTDTVKVAAFHVKGSQTYAIQFHPEVTHSIDGKQVLQNFLVDICGCAQDWTPDSFIETTIAALQQKLGDDKVVLGLSGGVDSSVAAVLLHHAIGKNLHCIFVDNGLLRKDEYQSVLDSYQHMGLNIKGVDAKQRFYDALAGLTDPEKKRKAIGRVFIEVFDDEAHKVTDVKWLGHYLSRCN